MNNEQFRHISLYDGPEQSPGYLLWRVSTQWRSSIEKVLKRVNLTHPQFVVLAALGWLTKDGQKVNQVAIAKVAHLDPNTISQIMRSLEKKGFIKREHSVDERSKNPSLTSLGSSVLKKALPLVEQEDVRFFSKLEEAQLVNIVQLFQKLAM